MSSGKLRIVVLASGRGSNFFAIQSAIKEGQIQNAQIVALICNKKTAAALDIAKKENITAVLIESKGMEKSVYEKNLLVAIQSFQPDLICLAGYMKILGKEIIETFSGKIINIHPSLLPKYKGLEAQRQALEAGEKETGCTVHVVTEGMDEGPIIEQARLAILADDTADSLSQRLLPLEHKTYIRALQKIPSYLAMLPKPPEAQ